jgi:hypothetical protein
LITLTAVAWTTRQPTVAPPPQSRAINGFAVEAP